MKNQTELWGNNMNAFGFGNDNNNWNNKTTNNWWQPQQKSSIDPKLRSMVESKIIKLVSGFTGNALEFDNQGKTKILFTQGDGMWAMVDRPFSKIIVKQEPTHYPGEPVGLESGFKLKIPKLPYKLFGQILSFFRHYVFDLGYHGCTEAMVWVYYDSRNQEYFIEIPKQEVSGGGVKYLFEDQNPRCKEQGVYRVFDIHSHNTMSAFFSCVDDRDEKGWQFYGVIGEIGRDNKDAYTTAFRAGIDGYYHNSNYSELVEPIDESIDISYPKEWENKVTMLAPSVFTSIEPINKQFDYTDYTRDIWGPNTWEGELSKRYTRESRNGRAFFPKTHTVDSSQNSQSAVDKKMRRICGLAERIMLNLDGVSPRMAEVFLDNNPEHFDILMDLQKAIDHISIDNTNLGI